MEKNTTKFSHLYVEIMEFLKTSNVSEEKIIEVDNVLTEVDRELFYREMGWSREDNSIDTVVDLRMLNNGKKEPYKILQTNLELLLKMKIAAQNVFNKEYTDDFKEDEVYFSGAVVPGVYENDSGEEVRLTKEEIESKLIQRLIKAYDLNNIDTIYDTGYITAVVKDNKKYYTLSTYCKKIKENG